MSIGCRLGSVLGLPERVSAGLKWGVVVVSSLTLCQQAYSL